ncbi:GNAT family N-acetyltransferase [Schaalia sp. Marseille-Q2122]|uniref:GNAT family N-acetyltransferase n=1 Tax=Schaalia sp. Marseille-Q2122 TaxID=2736604 RepID=UPI0015891A47|nr:GNAT family N-acetyltransferase [Schaalia sp. Marseille-Q2122]
MPQIIPYRTEYRTAILALSISSWESVFPLTANEVPEFVFRSFYPNGWRERLHADLSTLLDQEPENVDVALDDNTPVGWICTRIHPEDSMAEIYVLAVAPTHQRRGIGQQLINCAVSRARSAGMKMLMVETGDDSGHAPARATYESQGFVRWPVARFFKNLDG